MVSITRYNELKTATLDFPQGNLLAPRHLYVLDCFVLNPFARIRYLWWHETYFYLFAM
jgi:hypothetical protein